MALAEREAAPREALRTWAAPVVLAMMAIVVTHHLTSYAMAGLLVALSLAYWYLRRSWEPPNPWPLAIFGILLAAFWLFVVASATVGYLSPVLSDAFDAIGSTIGGSDEPRGALPGRRLQRRSDPAGGARGGAGGGGAAAGRTAVRAQGALAPVHEAAAGAAVRDRRRRLLRHPRPPSRPGRLGDRQPGQRVPLRRPRLRPRLRLRRGAAALAQGPPREAADRRRDRPGAGRRRDLRLALGLAAGAAAAGLGRRRDDLLAAAEPGPVGRGACPAGASPPAPPTPACCSTPAARWRWPEARPTSKTCSKRKGWRTGWCRCCAATDIRYIAVDRRRGRLRQSAWLLLLPSRPRRRAAAGERRLQVRRRSPASPASTQTGRSRSSTWGGPMRGHGDLEAAVVAAALCALLALVLPFEPLRMLLAAPLCLFLPGYAIAATIFAARRIGRRQLPALQRRAEPGRARARRHPAQLRAGRGPRRLLGAAALPRRARLLPRRRAATAAGGAGPGPLGPPPPQPRPERAAGRRRAGAGRRGCSRLHPALGHQRDRLHGDLDLPPSAATTASGSGSAAPSDTTPPTDSWSTSAADAR